MGGYVKPEATIRQDLPSAAQYFSVGQNGMILDFNNGNQSMQHLAGSLGEGKRIPAELQTNINAMGQAFINLMKQSNVNILQTREFADAGLAGKDGQADPKKVGALLFAAASAQNLHRNGEAFVGFASFDNQLSVSDFGKLTRSPEDRKAILDIAANVERGIVSTKPQLIGQDVLQKCGQVMQDVGVRCANINEPIRPTAPTHIGGPTVDGVTAKC